MNQGQKFEVACGSAVFRQCLIVRIGVPPRGMTFSREPEDDDASHSRGRSLKCQMLVIVCYELSAVTLENRKEAFLIFAVFFRITDFQIGDHVDGDIGHSNSPSL